MTLEETKKRIFEDSDFVLGELEKIQVLFKMKSVIRYHHVREEVLDTESVAEHVYGMLTLIDYFQPLEDSESKWDSKRVGQMALYHDIDEILTGDRIGYLKNNSDRDQEYLAQQKVVAMLPDQLQEKINTLLKEYEDQETIESQFVKAIDKIEPLFHLINDNGKQICLHNKTTYAQNRSIKDKYVQNFTYIKRFNEVLSQYMLDNGFFTPEGV